MDIEPARYDRSRANPAERASRAMGPATAEDPNQLFAVAGNHWTDFHHRGSPVCAGGDSGCACLSAYILAQIADRDGDARDLSAARGSDAGRHTAR